MTTEKSHKTTLGLHSAGEGENGNVFSLYGPLNPGSTISQRTNKEAQLTGLVSSLERQVETLESRYYELLDTFLSVTNLLVKRGVFTSDTTTTNVIE